MESLHKPKNLFKSIEETSPLYDYWQSPQNDIDEKKRLEKASKDFPPASLFKKEPYKWEMLFQSIVREICRGDLASIEGLQLLITMLTKQDQPKTIQSLSNKAIFKDETVEKLKDYSEKPKTQKNPARFIRILFSIFTNPYNIEIKRQKIHIYEKTGYAFYSLKKSLY